MRTARPCLIVACATGTGPVPGFLALPRAVSPQVQSRSSSLDPHRSSRSARGRPTNRDPGACACSANQLVTVPAPRVGGVRDRRHGRFRLLLSPQSTLIISGWSIRHVPSGMCRLAARKEVLHAFHGEIRSHDRDEDRRGLEPAHLRYERGQQHDRERCGMLNRSGGWSALLTVCAIWESVGMGWGATTGRRGQTLRDGPGGSAGAFPPLCPGKASCLCLPAAAVGDRRSLPHAYMAAGPEVPGPPRCSCVTSAVSWPSWPGPS
jgi:hypothetical protein